MDRLPALSTDFTLHLPAMDSDLMPEWLYEPGPEIPLSQADVRRLYRNSACTDDSLSLASLRAPSPAELQSLWDDSESGSGSDDERDDDDENIYVSDADTDSTSATLHNAQISCLASGASALKTRPVSPPSPSSPRRHSDESLRLHTYSSADAELATCLETVDALLLCNPFPCFADVCYTAAVKREPQNGVSRGSNELERVTEEEEEEGAESEESSDDDDEPELQSPVQLVAASDWTSGVCVGNEPTVALSALALSPPYYAGFDSKPRTFSPDPTAAAEVAYLFLRTKCSIDPKDSVAAFPTHTIPREPHGRQSVRDIIRGFGIGRRDRPTLPAPA